MPSVTFNANEFLYKVNEKTINNTRHCTPSTSLCSGFSLFLHRTQPIPIHCTFRVRFELHLVVSASQFGDEILEILKRAAQLCVPNEMRFLHLCSVYAPSSASVLPNERAPLCYRRNTHTQSLNNSPNLFRLYGVLYTNVSLHVSHCFARFEHQLHGYDKYLFSLFQMLCGQPSQASSIMRYL